MGNGVEIKRLDMDAQELRQVAGRVKDGRVSRRLLAIGLVLEGVSRKVAAESCGMDPQTLRDWIHRYNDEGIDGLSNRGGQGVKPHLSSDQLAQLTTWVKESPDPKKDGVVRWRRADLARKIEMTFGIKLHERTIGTYLAKLGFRRMSVRPQHPKSDLQEQIYFKENFATLVAEILPDKVKKKPLEIWFQDKARVGQQGTITRVWAGCGTRPRAPRDTRHESIYIFGAACPGRKIAAGLIMSYVNTEAMGLHLAEISKAVAVDGHALLIADGAGWHNSKDLKVPDNITILKLPPYSPELNPMENVWQYLRANKLAFTVFDTYDEIVDKCCEAWNFFANDSERINSITHRDRIMIELVN